MTKKLVLVCHGYGPADNRVFNFARLYGFEVIEQHPHGGDDLNMAMDDIAGTIVFGGMFNAYDEDKHPFLRDEARWIETCMKHELPVLGICQGAQQIARLLGADVGPHPEGLHEFGYYEIRPTDEGKDILPVPHYFTQAHFHTFGIPTGAVHLAESDAYPNQAFRYGRNVYGLQFHPECTIEGFRRWQKNPPGPETPGVQSHAEQTRLMMAHDKAQAIWFYAFLETLFGTNS